MVLAFLGERRTQEDLLRLIAVEGAELEQYGLANDALVAAARRAGYHTLVVEPATPGELKYFIRHGLPVIVNYIEPGEQKGHFAVVVGYGRFRRNIILNDPEHGKNFRISEQTFVSWWRSGFEEHERWMLVISRAPFTVER